MPFVADASLLVPARQVLLQPPSRGYRKALDSASIREAARYDWDVLPPSTGPGHPRPSQRRPPSSWTERLGDVVVGLSPALTLGDFEQPAAQVRLRGDGRSLRLSTQGQTTCLDATWDGRQYRAAPP